MYQDSRLVRNFFNTYGLIDEDFGWTHKPRHKITSRRESDAYIVTAEMPGANNNNVEISYDDSILDIKCVDINYNENMKFSSGVVIWENVSASVKDGILTVTLPTKNTKNKGKISLTK
jgi:HSP20 family molecular chaperone IbpA